MSFHFRQKSQLMKLWRSSRRYRTLKLPTWLRNASRSTYFCFQGEIYEQTEGVAKGSPLSPIVANLFMEDLEEKVINSSPQKRRWWLRFVDNVFSNWPHGEDKLIELDKNI